MRVNWKEEEKEKGKRKKEREREFLQMGRAENFQQCTKQRPSTATPGFMARFHSIHVMPKGSSCTGVYVHSFPGSARPPGTALKPGRAQRDGLGAV